MSDTPTTPATGGSYTLVNGQWVRTEDPTVQDVEVAAPAEPTQPEPPAPVSPPIMPPMTPQGRRQAASGETPSTEEN